MKKIKGIGIAIFLLVIALFAINGCGQNTHEQES
jgi:predicted small lipoprotein YifL